MYEHRDRLRWKTTYTQIKKAGGEVQSEPKLAVVLKQIYSNAVFFAFWIQTFCEEGGGLTTFNNNASPTELVLVRVERREGGVVLWVQKKTLLLGMAGANPWLGGRLPQRDIFTHFLNMQRVKLGADGSSVNNKSSYWSIMLAQNTTESMNHTYPRA